MRFESVWALTSLYSSSALTSVGWNGKSVCRFVCVALTVVCVVDFVFNNNVQF